MRQFELIAPCHFGLEAVLKREILDLGYEISKVEDGKVSFWGDEEAVAYANMFLRTAERVHESSSVGRIYPGKRKVLGEKSFFDQKQTFQSF